MVKENNGRQLNEKGYEKFKQVSLLTKIFFGFGFIIFFGARCKAYYTQLPANLTTRRAPKDLNIPYLNQLFPGVALPSTFSSFEFPAISVCPLELNATLAVTECGLSSLATPNWFTGKRINGLIPCPSDGIISSQVAVNAFNNLVLECSTVYEGNKFTAGSTRDSIEMKFQLSNVPVGGIRSVLIITHANALDATKISFENSIVASSGTFVQLGIQKAWEIDAKGNGHLDYLVNAGSINAADADLIEMEVKYPILEILYVKEFNLFGSSTFVGELGGFLAVLFFIHRAIMYFTLVILCKKEKMSQVVGKNRMTRDEGFDRFS